MPITALLELRIKPDALDSAHDVLRSTLAATRAFPGCLGVNVLVDENDPAHIVLSETWESIERDQAYRAWRATPEGKSPLGPILTGPPALTHFTVAEDV